MKNKSNYIIENIRGIKNKVYELAIIAPLLCDKDLMIVRPYTQFPIETSDERKNYIDLYYEDIKLGIEIYEPFHEYQKERDDLRKVEIEKKLNCRIIEIKIDDDFVIYDVLEKLKGIIQETIIKEKQNSDYQDWEIKYHTLSQAQDDYPNAIFVNANNFSNGVHGPLKLNEKVRTNADLFVVYSGGTVHRVYEINSESWTQHDDSNLGFLQCGIELPNHKLVSSGATDWNVTTNRVLGNNIQEFSSYKKPKPNKKDNSKDNKYMKNSKFKKIIRKTTRKK
jgi:hypothetical protein